MIEVYTDGASSGNPGASGIGIYIKQGEKHQTFSIPIGHYSNHEAEFLAVLNALKICRDQFPGEILSFRSDSKAVVDVLEKEYTKNPKFIPFLKEALEEIRHFPYFFIKWIPEKQNKVADKLAREAIHKES
ncbi:reverse transcriptase-like protein [Aquibacillus sp. 3ASR75-11]|uniref:Reverse transcriptase-like protein n=1 Tax=Terrihalobacillus insolitus TaxID=2950438 RepID=A0A9X3WUA5_9BACI|nr:reverse transcriptase-like protein [Terrihalobacillus insolitus]MDC3424743.1 reverse transcriptase-like protein [Terrihalobacillus insolitus]